MLALKSWRRERRLKHFTDQYVGCLLGVPYKFPMSKLHPRPPMPSVTAVHWASAITDLVHAYMFMVAERPGRQEEVSVLRWKGGWLLILKWRTPLGKYEKWYAFGKDLSAMLAKAQGKALAADWNWKH